MIEVRLKHAYPRVFSSNELTLLLFFSSYKIEIK